MDTIAQKHTPENNDTIEYWNTNQLQEALKIFEEQNPGFAGERDQIIKNYVKWKEANLENNITSTTKLKLEELKKEIEYTPTPWNLNEDFTPTSEK